ncbi:succinate dehydrogenase subunit 6, mitochondrial-like [Pistacia vera]|uniref:succinate dehydrogenase subunit 6, mitochondrial-like n=1 Tax=Pistacia vera TaxID=55513 RepID=UPI0012636290|nr:succinate dehydrogenase subunit 6, mitochondrial-like [Pistacia vera]
MGESREQSFWGERFSFLQNYSRFIKRDKPLPSWSSSDVDEFITSDPVHGPTLKTAREAVNFAITGSVIGAASTAGTAWKYSRSLHGTGLSLAAGAVFGWTFGHEVANQWFQLYRLDTMAAQVKFMEWWEKKTEGRA